MIGLHGVRMIMANLCYGLWKLLSAELYIFISFFVCSFIAVDALGKTDGTASFDFFDPSLKWSLHIMAMNTYAVTLPWDYFKPVG